MRWHSMSIKFRLQAVVHGTLMMQHTHLLGREVAHDMVSTVYSSNP